WDERVLDAVRVPETVDARRLRVVAAVDRLAGGDRRRRRQYDVRRLSVVAEVRGRADRLGGDRVVDEVLRETRSDDVVRHGRRVGPDALQLVTRVADEPAPAGAARRAGEDGVAVLRLNVGPAAAADAVEERVQVRLQRLARVELAVGVRGLEAAGPLRAPVDEIDGGRRLDADRAAAGIAAVVDQIVRRRVGDGACRVLAGRPEEVLRVRERRRVGGRA